MKPRIALSKLAIVLGAAALLSACGPGKVVNTQDNSADYKSARSLPPLKKPTPVVVTQRAPAEVAEEQVDVSPKIEATPIEAAQQDSVEAELTDLDVVADSERVANSAQTEISDEADAGAVIGASETPNAKQSVSVIDVDSGQARLKIDTGFDQAWVYLSDSLKKSDLTVFSRNRAAGRFSIGCATIAAAPTVTKKGRWSFFNRDRQPRLEYCALQAVERRGATLVSVLNRSGEEVTAEYSRDVFNRLLSK